MSSFWFGTSPGRLSHMSSALTRSSDFTCVCSLSVWSACFSSQAMPLLTITLSPKKSHFAKVSSWNYHLSDNVWLFIWLMSLTLVIMTVFAGLKLVSKVKDILETKSMFYNKWLFAPLLTILFANLFIQIMGSTWDIFFRFDSDETCSILTGNVIFDSIVYIFFKLSVVNYWIWPLVFAYSAKSMYKLENRSLDSYDSIDFYTSRVKGNSIFPYSVDGWQSTSSVSTYWESTFHYGVVASINRPQIKLNMKRKERKEKNSTISESNSEAESSLSPNPWH